MIKKLTIVLILLVTLVGCGQVQNKKESKTLLALDTVISMNTFGKNAKKAIDGAEKYIYDFEDNFSRTKEGSLIFQLNRNYYLDYPSVALLELIQCAAEYNQLTDGAFDITIAGLADLWGFTKSEFKVPSKNEINQELETVGMEHIKYSDNRLTLDQGTKIDFGGIAKGLIAEEIGNIYHENNLISGFVNLGGDVLVYGKKPNDDDWAIGIQNPLTADDLNNYVGILNLNDVFVFTSGNYQRYFDVDGKRYHHIIDPKTGYPADNDLLSVTIVTDFKKGNGIKADALSTALFALGKEKAIDLWNDNQEAFDILIINNKNEIFISKNLSTNFVLTNSDFKLNILN